MHSIKFTFLNLLIISIKPVSALLKQPKIKIKVTQNIRFIFNSSFDWTVLNWNSIRTESRSKILSNSFFRHICHVSHIFHKNHHSVIVITTWCVYIYRVKKCSENFEAVEQTILLRVYCFLENTFLSSVQAAHITLCLIYSVFEYAWNIK